MLNFDFLKKGLEIVSPPYFVAWLPLLLEILVNMCIAIVRQPGCDVTNFEMNLIFIIKPFSKIIKKSRQKFKYPEQVK